MSDPISSIGILSGKGVAIIYALGGALLTLAFYEPVNQSIPRWKMFLISLGNVAMSWFSGFVIGDAVNEYLCLEGSVANSIYTISAIMGLLIVGTLYRIAQSVRDNPEVAVKKWFGQ